MYINSPSFMLVGSWIKYTWNYQYKCTIIIKASIYIYTHNIKGTVDWTLNQSKFLGKIAL